MFCVLSTSAFAMTALLGRMVSGVLILYSLLMAVTLGPGIALYVIPEAWYEHVEALLRVASGKPPKKIGSDDGEGGDNNTTNPDAGLDEFLPEVDESLLSRQLSLSLESSDLGPSSVSLQTAVARELGTVHLASLAEESRLSEGLGSFPDYDEDADLESFLPDISTMPSLSDSLSPAPTSANNNTDEVLANVVNGIHFVASHFRQSSSDSEASEEAATIGADFGRRFTRSRGHPEASQSRPLAVGPTPQRPSRHNSQGSDIDIDEYEVVDTRDLPST